MGKTSPTLTSRFNNHRTMLKQLCDLFLYNQFNSDGQSHSDVSIMPTEGVHNVRVHIRVHAYLEPKDSMSLAQGRK